MKLKEFRDFFREVKQYSLVKINDIECRVLAMSNYALIVQEIGEGVENEVLDTTIVDYNEIKQVELVNELSQTD